MSSVNYYGDFVNFRKQKDKYYMIPLRWGTIRSKVQWQKENSGYQGIGGCGVIVQWVQGLTWEEENIPEMGSVAACTTVGIKNIFFFQCCGLIHARQALYSAASLAQDWTALNGKFMLCEFYHKKIKKSDVNNIIYGPENTNFKIMSIVSRHNCKHGEKNLKVGILRLYKILFWTCKNL
jgi:hypothetical protein